MKALLRFFAPLLAAAMLLPACSQPKEAAQAPDWLEPDSAQAIRTRLLRDFPYTFDEGAAIVMEAHPELTIDSVRRLVEERKIESLEIDGQQRIFRKALRNLNLLHPAYNGGWKHRGWDASEQRIAFADSVKRWSEGKLADGGAHRVKIRFSIDVPYDQAIAGDTLRVWMPYPRESERLGDVEFVSSFPAERIIADPTQSVHSSIYFEQPAPAPGDTAHFEYVAEFTTKGAYFAPAKILSGMKPYDTENDLYKQYTAFDGPHYAQLDSLARAIVGDEANPYRQSELVYDYIINRYPWASMRDYSTIPCIPAYVVEEGHGDCGQVALLYISLMRSLGVPARWESGWMLHPGEVGLHDWAETYYEGVGWVPVDVSFGRYDTAADPAIQKFYSTGIDSHRFVANKGVGGQFFPPKRFVRSETVDFQEGEVECSRGNLYFTGWDNNFEILSQTPIAQ